jgi:hypothetical protein
MHIGCGCVFPAQVGEVELEIMRGRRRPHERGADEKGRTTRDMGSAGPCAAIARWGPASHGGRLVLRMQTHERSLWIDARSICIWNDSKAKEPPCSSLGYASTEHATARTRLLQRRITSEATCPRSEFSRQCGGLCSGCCCRLLLSVVDERRALVTRGPRCVGLGVCDEKKRAQDDGSACIPRRYETRLKRARASVRYMHRRRAHKGRGPCATLELVDIEVSVYLAA